MDRGKRVAVRGALWIAADAEPAAGPIEIETVTAIKTEHLAFEVAGSVSMVAAETIEAEQPQSLNDILKALPNIELFSGPRRLGEEADICGFSDERIVTTLDGALQNFSINYQGRFVLEPDLLKQVEIYRGANSALYGSGALGGVIALTTKDPSDFLEAEEILGARLKGGFQSVNDEWLGSLAVFGRLSPALECLGHFSYRDSSDIKLGNGETLADSAERSIAASGKLYWRPLPYHESLVSIDQFHTEGDFSANPQNVPSRDNEVADTDIERRTYTVGYRYDDPQDPWARIETTAYRFD